MYSAPSNPNYLNELINEMRQLSETAIECKNARILLSKEISRVFDEMSRRGGAGGGHHHDEMSRRGAAGGGGHHHNHHDEFFGQERVCRNPFQTPKPLSSTSSTNVFYPPSASSFSFRDSLPSNPFATPIKNTSTSPKDGDWQENSVSEEKFVLQTKIYIPDPPPSRMGGRSVKCNYIGRILGPSGMSARMLERQFDVTLLIRGSGSVRNMEQEQLLKGKKGYEHLEEPLHVLLIARHADKRKCEELLDKAADRVESLLTPAHDDYKKDQLVHYAIMNGTYEERPNKKRPESSSSFLK
ncbi:unnamed protein product [Caenorhabditis sp. 36 PRJEB53466]|nr:unnamed protein product [Caenorhabditis sp. 36 PRJEB53466]